MKMRVLTDHRDEGSQLNSTQLNSNPRRICRYEKSVRNPFRICSYEKKGAYTYISPPVPLPTVSPLQHFRFLLYLVCDNFSHASSSAHSRR